MTDSLTPIGGYMGLELPFFRNSYEMYSHAYKFQSARASFLALLAAGAPKKIWMPRYMCGVMLEPIFRAGVELKFYNLDENFLPKDVPALQKNEWLLYINYFGVCNKNVLKISKNFPISQIVFDFSQAYFSGPVLGACATLYSPRKFIGVPDGGLLVTDLKIKSPVVEDFDSIERMTHLIKRIAISPEAGYGDFLSADESLQKCEPMKMSRLTEILLSSVDYKKITKIRNSNYNFLESRLGEKNGIRIGRGKVNAPLCYPYLSNDSSLREKLISKKVYVPIYWPDSIARVDRDWAINVIDRMIPIPIDQRYGLHDMERIVNIINEESDV